MKPEFWLERWERNEIGFHQERINVHLQEFWDSLGVPEGATVFVPLCGKSRDMLWLRSRGYRVLGVEISHLAVEAFFAENELQPEVTETGRFRRWECDGLTVLCGDFFDLSAEQLKDAHAAFDRASLIALPPEMRAAYGKHLTALLPEAAEVLLVTMEYSPGEMDGPPFPVEETEVRALYEPGFEVARLWGKDILADNPRFRERGLTRLQEAVYRLRRR